MGRSIFFIVFLEDEKTIPVIKVVIGGDVNLVQTMTKALECGVRFVLVKGSGGAADLVADGCKMATSLG